jgi:hypothetical protein
MMEDYIDITPLELPFEPNFRQIKFSKSDKKLAISSEDYDRLCAFLGTERLKGLRIRVNPSPDHAERLRVTVELK